MLKATFRPLTTILFLSLRNGWPAQVPSGETRNLVQQLVSQQALSLKEEYGHLEKDLNINVYDHPERSSSVLTQDSQTKLLTLLTTLPHGVIKWSHAVPGEQVRSICKQTCTVR